MISHKYCYWHFKNALSKKFCDDIFTYCKDLKLNKGKVGKNKDMSTKDLKKVRDSDVIFLNQMWIYREFQPFIQRANKNAGWNFQWDFTEPIQFTEYKKDQFYGWHHDGWEEPYNDPKNLNMHGKIRKLSIIAMLSDPKDYKGGELEFDLRNRTNGKPSLILCKEGYPKGSIIIFPSFVWHRIKPVTAGVRNSLVGWNVGHPFK
tara:strand:+ start:164 stop:775 length:612 start_codon:yes stop_codon:yes gene_type:complete